MIIKFLEACEIICFWIAGTMAVFGSVYFLEASLEDLKGVPGFPWELMPDICSIIIVSAGFGFALRWMVAKLRPTG